MGIKKTDEEDGRWILEEEFRASSFAIKEIDNKWNFFNNTRKLELLLPLVNGKKYPFILCHCFF